MSDASLPSVAVVMPAYNAAHHLPRTLGRLLEIGDHDELLLVNPGSTDDTAVVAAAMGVRVVTLPQRGGPAEARNAGVAEVTAEIVLFVDSDCVIAEDTIERVRRAFTDPSLVTLTGSYDDDPPEKNFASLYMNLRHHHTHQLARRENATFWAGCGAVRRSVFEKVGGFDADRFPRPMIEDIELGQRMGTHGATRLDPELHATHLKRWSIPGVVTTDIFSRAVPWTRLIAEGGSAPDDLNLRMSQRVAALVAPFAILAVLLLPFTYILGRAVLAGCLVVIVLSLLLNSGLVRFFARAQGWGFACLGWFFHQVHLFYSAVTYVLCRLFAPKSAETEATI